MRNIHFEALLYCCRKRDLPRLQQNKILLRTDLDDDMSTFYTPIEPGTFSLTLSQLSYLAPAVHF